MVGRLIALVATLLLSSCQVGTGELTIQHADEPIIIYPDGPGSSSVPGQPGSSSSGGVDDGTPSKPDNETNTSDPATTCGSGEALCGGVCTSVTENDENCGDCGVVCDGGRVCMQSACACEVGEFCDGACVDTTMSSAHCGACDNPCAGGQACIGGTCEAVGQVQGVLLATNEARASGANCGSQGTFGPAPPLEGDPNLHQAAQVHADDMAANNFFDHTGSDGSSFSQRIFRTDFSGQPIGENIAAGNRTAQATVDQWLGSDGHCANLMNPNATKLGVGYAEGGPYGTLWVQVFGR